MWCVADLDDDYIRKMEDVLATYEMPLNPSEPFICLDEKPVSLPAEVRPPSPAIPRPIAKRDGEYKRCGTVNVFCVWSRRMNRKHVTINWRFTRRKARIRFGYQKNRSKRSDN
jgi:hypothetical protein